MPARARGWVAGAALSWVAGPAGACGLALILAVDVSSSVERHEYRIQMDGLATALEDPEIAHALALNQARVAVIQWSGAGQQSVSVDWTAIGRPEDAAAVADLVRGARRDWHMSRTGIGDVLVLAADLFNDVPACRRRVVDVSGDGFSNDGVAPGEVRGLMRDRGITVNGLAIEESAAALSDYYRAEVISGPGAFVMTAATFLDYPDMITRKLLREVSDPVGMLME